MSIFYHCDSLGVDLSLKEFKYSIDMVIWLIRYTYLSCFECW